jgi:hypothetical protein
MAVSRRTLLQATALTLLGAACSPPLPAGLSPAPDPTGPGTPGPGTREGGRPVSAPATTAGRRVPTVQDLRLRGTYRLPGGHDGLDLAFGSGLALRSAAVGRTVFTGALGGEVVELAVPSALGGGAQDAPPAQVVRVWGDLAGGRRTFADGRTGDLSGLHWDQRAERLWWSFGDVYNATSDDDPAVGASVLHEDGSVEVLGPWRFTGRGQKAVMGGVTAVPSWFADRWCAGRTLAAGFGGYVSIVATGPASMGPALSAFDPHALAATPPGTTAAFTDLVGYPFTSQPGPGTDRCRRHADVVNEVDGWTSPGADGLAPWTWADRIGAGGAWVDTPAVSGFLTFPVLGGGRIAYGDGYVRPERLSHWVMAYDPADLARVATGEVPQWGIQPARQWPLVVPGVPASYPWSPDAPGHDVSGVAWDGAAAHLHVAVRFAAAPTDDAPYGSTLVCVYDVTA